MSNNLLLKFREKDTPHGVTRETLRTIAKEMEMSETQAIHLALSKLARDVLPAYEPDDGPLTAKQLKALRAEAEKLMPTGKTLRFRSLF